MEIETDEIVEVWAEHITRARHYRAVLLVMGACMALTLLALWGVARRPHPAPVVVRVDEVGRAEAVDYLPEAIEPAGPEQWLWHRRGAAWCLVPAGSRPYPRRHRT